MFNFNCKSKNNCKNNCDKIKMVMSSFYDGVPPISFTWVEDLLKLFPLKYNITILLHGECLKYGLKESVYVEKYGTTNPYAPLLKNFDSKGVKIVICNYCISQQGFNDNQLLLFVEPIKFSIDYIATRDKMGDVIIFDAQL